MNYSKGTQRIALVAYVVWSILLLGAILTVCLTTPNWSIAKLAFIALAVPLFPLNVSNIHLRLLALLVFAGAFSAVPISPDTLTAAGGYLALGSFIVLLVIGGVAGNKCTSVVASSAVVPWDKKPLASLLLTFTYLVSASWVFPWALFAISPTASAAVHLVVLLFPAAITFAAWVIFEGVTKLLGFVVGGFRQDQQ